MPSISSTFGAHSVDVNKNTGFTETKFRDAGFKTTSFTNTSFHNGSTTKDSINALVTPVRSSTRRQLAQANSKDGIAPSAGIGTKVVTATTGGIASPLKENALATDTSKPDREYYAAETLQSYDGIFTLEIAQVKTLNFTDEARNPVKIEFMKETLG